MPTERRAFREDVEGIRGIAVSMVVLFHARHSWAVGGYLGVDVFLVISGYLIIGHLAQEASQTGTLALANFWARRARRLIPAATLVILTTLLASVLVSAPTEFADHAKSARAAALYVSNFLFLGYGGDYFRANAEADPFLHTWSLSLEEQFYLVIAPMVFATTWLFARAGSSAPLPTQERRPSRRAFAYPFGAVTVMSYALYVVTSRRDPMRAFYMLAPRAWEFGAGGLIGLVPQTLSMRSASAKRWIGWAALCALVASMPVLAFTGRATYLVAVVPVLATVALLGVGDGSEGAPTGAARVLCLTPLRYLGRVSYSWYLWHWPVASLWGRLPLLNRLPVAVGMPAISLFLAALSYRWVEIPFRNSRTFARSAAYGLLGGASLALLVVAVSTAGRRYAHNELAKAEYLPVLESRVLNQRGRRCALSFKDDSLTQCALGDTTAARTIVLFGDSHAEHLVPAVDRAASELHVRLLFFSKSGCPWVDVTPFTPALGLPYRGCDSWRASAVRYLEEHPPVVVILAAKGRFIMVDSTGRQFSADGDSARYALAWERGAQPILRRLARGSQVMLVQDVPFPGFDVSTCVERNIYDPARCSFDRAKASSGPPWGADMRLATSIPRVRLLDLTNDICPSEQCSPIVDRAVTYRDGNHLGHAFAGKLAGRFKAALGDLLNR